MDQIHISGCRVETSIGYYEWERRLPQNIELDLDISLPAGADTASDRIRDTIDYAAVVTRIRETAKSQHFQLLERFCEHVAQTVLSEFGAPWVRVSAAKIGIVRGVRKVAVTIERGTRSQPRG